ncbi:MAG: AMP-binding protein [Thermaerobacter sp.]|nr:AMP-binding protein [Thermaerobacter sp.]
MTWSTQPDGDSYEAVETLPREELLALQLSRAATMVRALAVGSPFYRAKWAASGAEPGDIQTLADFSRLPLVTKDELRREQAEFPPYGRLTVAPRSTWREVHPSSGTTGQQVRTIWTQQDVENITAFTARLLWQMGIRPGDTIQNAFSYGLWIAGMAVHYAAHRLGALNIPIGGQPAAHQLRYLRELGPRAVFATPSFGLYVAETLAREGVDPRSLGLALGAFGGEAGVELGGTRRRLEAGLGIRAYDIYGLSEIAPTMAAECPAQSGLHWAEDHFLVEILDPVTGDPVPEGTAGMLVLTHLCREGTPMIRYQTNDIARYTSAPCPCGRTHGRSEGGILGRLDDLVVYRGVKFYPTEVEAVVRQLEGFTGEYVVEVQGGTSPNQVTVVAEATRPTTNAATVLRRALKVALLTTPQVRVVPAGTLGRTEFKSQRLHRL